MRDPHPPLHIGSARRLPGHPGIEIRVTRAASLPAVDRVDGNLLITPNAGLDRDRAVVLVRQATAPALFARLCDDYGTAWAAAGGHRPTRTPIVADQPAAPISEPLLGPLDRPRRWPRRAP